MIKHPKLIVDIGASAVGLNALVEIGQTMQKGLNIAYCIVLNLSPKGIYNFVVHCLSQVTSLPCNLAIDNHAVKQIDIDYIKKGYKSLSANNVEKQDKIGHPIEKLKEGLFDLQTMKRGDMISGLKW